MSKYKKDFIKLMVDLISSGQKIEQLSKDYNVSTRQLYRWKQAYLMPSDPQESISVQLDKEEEIQQLKKELAELRVEHEILKKAIHIFSKRDGSDIFS